MAGESFQDMVPKSRIGIKVKVAKDGATEEVELPLKLLILGDFTQQEDQTPLQDRKPLTINKNNFDDVMEKMNLGLSVVVPNKLTDAEDEDMKVDMTFNSIKDFHPGRIAEQIPALKKLLNARNLLKDLKARAKTKPEIRKALKGHLSQLEGIAKGSEGEEMLKKLEEALLADAEGDEKKDE